MNSLTIALPYTDDPPQGLPPPYVPLPYLTRSDAALPPGYDSDWSQVQADVKLPWFIKPDRLAFASYLQDTLLIPPKWFHALEQYILSSGTLQPLQPQFHWCLRLLYYQPALPPMLMTSDLACEIFCEIIWITLTPKPYEWLGGCEEIKRRTGWKSDQIQKWFKQRSQKCAASVYYPPSVNPNDTTHYELVERLRFGGHASHSVTIRPAAADFLLNPQLGVRWDHTAFGVCVTHWLKDLADRCTPLKHFFLNPLYDRPSLSTICGIHVGPYDWSEPPMQDLWAIEHGPLPTNSLQDIGIRSYSVVPARRYDCRIFCFADHDHVNVYMNYWTSSETQTFLFSGVAVSVYNHSTHR